MRKLSRLVVAFLAAVLALVIVVLIGANLYVQSQGTQERIQQELQEFFTPEMGFGKIVSVDYTDGVRVIFDNGDVAHLRPSGNADEFRVYAVADTQDRAHAIASMAAAEPSGILRTMEKALITGE